MNTPEELRLLKESAGVDLLLCENVEGELAESISGIPMAILSDVKGNGATVRKEVFKYQSVSEITADVLRAMSVHEEKKPKKRAALAHIAIIGVMSPIGRCGKTSFCLALGQLLSQHDEVLYISLEPFSGFRSMFSETPHYGLSDLLYAAHAGMEGGEESFVIHYQGLDMIAAVSSPGDIFDTDAEEVRKTIESYLSTHSYDYVIIDFGFDGRLISSMLPILTKVFVPTRKDALSAAKGEEFLTWLRRLTGDNELSVETCELPAPKAFSGNKNQMATLLFSEMGEYVRRLVDGATA